MATHTLTAIRPLPAARTYALVAGSLALVMGVLKLAYSLYLYATRDLALTVGQLLTRTLGEVAVSVATALVVGAVVGLVVSWCYNWWAKRLGGLTIELDEQRR